MMIQKRNGSSRRLTGRFLVITDHLLIFDHLEQFAAILEARTSHDRVLLRR